MKISKELLRDLAQLAETERTIMSAYIDTTNDWDATRKFVESERERLLSLLTKDEAEYFDVSLTLLKDYLNKKSSQNYRGPGLAFFADIGADYSRGVELTVSPEKSFIALDKEALILPLALELDEYEPVGVIVADASGARIFVAAGQTIEDAHSLRTKIHHLSKVGGWSQMRYQRRRDKQVKHFSKDVAENARKIFSEIGVKRILLAGRERILDAIHNELAKNLQDMVIATVKWDLDAGEDDFLKKIAPIFEQIEREQEKNILEKFVAELRRNGLAVKGIEETQTALRRGQVDMLLLDEMLDSKIAEQLTSLAEATSAYVEFFPQRNEVMRKIGGIGAILRYK